MRISDWSSDVCSSDLNFAVGTTYSKTEIIQVALLGLILLGDTISAAGVFAIALGMVGILALSVAHQSVTWKALATGLFERTTMIGLLCGAFLGADRKSTRLNSSH